MPAVRRKYFLAFRLTVLALSACAAAQAARAASELPERDAVLGCVITPHAEARVGSPVIGVLHDVFVDRGSMVKKGQPLARLTSRVELANVGAAARRYANEADAEAARMAAELAQKKATRARELHAVNFISQQALDQALAEAEVAAMQYTRAKEQRLTAEKDLSVAEAQLALRTIVSPFDGIVAERYLSAGERVEDKPIVKVVQTDPLKVEVVLSAERFNSVKVNTQAVVTPDLKGSGALTASVTHVDPMVDVASNTFRVRLRMSNPQGRIPPGLRCKVSFQE